MHEIRDPELLEITSKNSTFVLFLTPRICPSGSTNTHRVKISMWYIRWRRVSNFSWKVFLIIIRCWRMVPPI